MVSPCMLQVIWDDTHSSKWYVTHLCMCTWMCPYCHGKPSFFTTCMYMFRNFLIYACVCECAPIAMVSPVFDDWHVSFMYVCMIPACYGTRCFKRYAAHLCMCLWICQSSHTDLHSRDGTHCFERILKFYSADTDLQFFVVQIIECAGGKTTNGKVSSVLDVPVTSLTDTCDFCVGRCVASTHSDQCSQCTTGVCSWQIHMNCDCCCCCPSD
jgi:hypothetical protein